NLLLAAAALVLIVPCVAAAPFAFRIGVNPQSPTVSPDGAVVSSRASVVTVQQGASQKAKQEEQATEEERQRELTRKVAKIGALRLKERQLQDASSKQEGEARKMSREAEEKLRAEREAMERDPELMAHRKLEREMMARRQAELAKKATITM